ncbi:hypothetical protein OFN48_32835, partial [Escherichia coli]|nr:hypothetical protein [Escherichia coli]
MIIISQVSLAYNKYMELIMPLSRRNFIQNAVLGISAAGLSSAPALAKNISSSTTHIISKTSGHADT